MNITQKRTLVLISLFFVLTTATSGFGPKGDKQCEYATLFDGMRDNNLS